MIPNETKLFKYPTFYASRMQVTIMRKLLFILAFMAIWIVVIAVGVLFGFNYNWPDYGHVDYGIPLNWATNTLSTIAGPAKRWNVNISNLLIDIVFWLVIMTAIVAILIYKIKE